MKHDFQGVIMRQPLLRKIGLACLLVFAGLLLFAGIVAGATGYPARTDAYVNDYAGVLDSSSEQTIRDLFQQLENDTGTEAVVVTVNSIRDYGTGDSTIESFATNLFNTWGIGSWQEDNGILILVAVQDRACRIEMGAGYGHQYDSAMQHVIDEHMLPYFKSGNYQTGIVEGSRNVIGSVTESNIAENIIGSVTGAASSKHYVFWNSGDEFVAWLSKYKVEIIAAAIGLIALSIALRLILRPIFRLFSSLEDYSGGGGSGGGSSGGGGASGRW
jgi:uncharacterized membrane protein YgcG